VRARLLCASLATAAVLALPSAASAAPLVIGVGEQDARIFSSAPWTQLGVSDVRYIVPWDALSSAWQRQELDTYMADAENVGARVLLGFGHSRTQSRRRVLPSPRQFQREFRRFRARYPFITTYLTWNEANHCSQPTCRRPGAVARFYDILKDECVGCTVVGPAVLDKSDMPQWVHAVERHAKHRIGIWAIHNYIDANRFRTRGTKALLRTVKGQIWFTETGGLVRRDNGSTIEFANSPTHAARATSWVFKLARLSPRVRRVYFYHWIAPQPDSTWDSALVDARGKPRPALAVIKRYIRGSRAAERR
jgi:hypothetical protein